MFKAWLRTKNSDGSVLHCDAEERHPRDERLVEVREPLDVLATRTLAFRKRGEHVAEALHHPVNGDPGHVDSRRCLHLPHVGQGLGQDTAAQTTLNL